LITVNRDLHSLWFVFQNGVTIIVSKTLELNLTEKNKNFPFDGDYRRNPKTDFFCAMCQKDIVPNSEVYHVYLGDPAEFIVDPKRLDGSELKVPIGPECAKKIPAAYRVK